MKPLERPSRRAAIRAGIIVSGAMMMLAVSLASARRPGPATHPAAPNEQAAQQSTGIDRSAREVRGASPYQNLEDEPAPRLIVDAPLPDLLDRGVVWIQWRVENVHIVPVFGKGALDASPRVGHLHVHVDEVPWWWADASNINTIDLAGMPPGPHKIRIELVDANHQVFPGQSKTVAFTVGKGGSRAHGH